MASAAIGLKREAKDLMTHRLFVYGTLLPGEINAGFLEPLRGSWQRGRVQGALSPQGWSARRTSPRSSPATAERGFRASLLELDGGQSVPAYA